MHSAPEGGRPEAVTPEASALATRDAALAMMGQRASAPEGGRPEAVTPEASALATRDAALAMMGQGASAPEGGRPKAVTPEASALATRDAALAMTAQRAGRDIPVRSSLSPWRRALPGCERVENGRHPPMGATI